jgi:hypothetical protein
MELAVKGSQSSTRRTALIFAGLAIVIGSAVGFAVTELNSPFFLLLGVGGLAIVAASIASAGWTAPLSFHYLYAVF